MYFEKIREKLKAIKVPKDDRGWRRLTEKEVRLIAEAFDGDHDAFWVMDNKPGNWSDRELWHWKLRQARNHPSGLFFKILSNT
jgi:hypothetical protein